MHKLPQTAIKLSHLTNKTCSHIQRTLLTVQFSQATSELVWLRSDCGAVDRQ